MSRKIRRVETPAPRYGEGLDHWLHAVAFVILRRQMRGKWSSDIATPAQV